MNLLKLVLIIYRTLCDPSVDTQHSGFVPKCYVYLGTNRSECRFKPRSWLERDSSNRQGPNNPESGILIVGHISPMEWQLRVTNAAKARTSMVQSSCGYCRDTESDHSSSAHGPPVVIATPMTTVTLHDGQRASLYRYDNYTRNELCSWHLVHAFLRPFRHSIL